MLKEAARHAARETGSADCIPLRLGDASGRVEVCAFCWRASRRLQGREVGAAQGCWEGERYNERATGVVRAALEGRSNMSAAGESAFRPQSC